MKKLIYNLLTISLPAFVLFFVFLEIFLRITGAIYIASTHPKAYFEVRSPDATHVLCLGDSFTRGYGVGPADSYPAQLEKLLRKNISRNIRVVNAGADGNSSSLLAMNLGRNLDTYRPMVVVIMVGCNNHWNVRESSYLALSKENNFKECIASFIDDLRLTRLFRLLRVNYTYKTLSLGDLSMMSDRGEGSGVGLMNGIDNNSALLTSEAEELFNNANYSAAIEKATKALELDKKNFNAHLVSSKIFIAMHEYREAKVAMEHAIESVDSWEERLVCVFIERIHRLPFDDQQQLLLKLKNKVSEMPQTRKIKNTLKAIDTALAFLKDQTLANKVLYDDLDNIIQLALSHKVKLIIMSYPHKWMCNILAKEICERRGVSFVDNEALFSNIVKQNPQEALFCLDKHCNERGNHFVAENVYNQVRSFLSDQVAHHGI